MKIFSIKYSHMMTWGFYALKIIGLAAFDQRTVTPARNSPTIPQCYFRVFRASKIGQAYNCLVLILMIIMGAIEIPTLFSTNTNSTPIIRYIDTVLGSLNYLTASVVIAFWALRQDAAASAMNKLMKVARLIHGFEKQPLIFDQRMSKVFWIHVVLNTCIWIMMIGSDIKLFWGKLSFPVVIFYDVPVFIFYCYILEYSMVIVLLFQQLKRLNDQLSRLEKSPNYLSRFTFVNDHLSVLSLSIRDHCSQLSVVQLISTTRIHLREISQEIANFFALPILFSIGCSFANLVYNCYYTLSPFLDVNGVFSIDHIVNGVAWMSMSTYPVAMLSFTVTKTIKEARLTARIIHKLLTKAMTRESRTELEQFSLQLLHEDFSFTANGFFELDCTLLNSILGAGTTYLVILIQFQQASSIFPNSSR